MVERELLVQRDFARFSLGPFSTIIPILRPLYIGYKRQNSLVLMAQDPCEDWKVTGRHGGELRKKQWWFSQNFFHTSLDIPVLN